MDETFPFKSREDMERVLADIERRWPEFGDRCHHILEARRKLRD